MQIYLEISCSKHYGTKQVGFVFVSRVQTGDWTFQVCKVKNLIHKFVSIKIQPLKAEVVLYG